MKVDNILMNMASWHSVSWTPTFSWSNGDTPTMANISCIYIKLGAIYYFGGRFQMTAKNTSSTTASLQMSMPFTIAHVTPQVLGELYADTNSYAKPLLIRTGSSGTSVYFVSGIGGGYTSNVMATGYYGFGFFWFKKK